MLIKAVKTSLFLERGDLEEFIVRHIKKIKDKSVIVVTSKIVALAEGRTAEIKNKKTKEQIIKQESQMAFSTKYTWLTIKDGVVMSSAGIDESNANGKLILLPKDSFKTAENLRKFLQKKYHIKNIGVLITDSHLMPLRSGVVAIALGYAGFEGIKDYRGKKDIFGRKFKMSRTNVADSLATASVLAMGEGRELCPLAIIEEAPVKFCSKVNKNELKINPKDDIYGPLFLKLKKING